MSQTMPQPCELCHREMPTLTEHHLIPRQKTKRKGLDPSSTIQIYSQIGNLSRVNWSSEFHGFSLPHRLNSSTKANWFDRIGGAIAKKKLIFASDHESSTLEC